MAFTACVAIYYDVLHPNGVLGYIKYAAGAHTLDYFVEFGNPM